MSPYERRLVRLVRVRLVLVREDRGYFSFLKRTSGQFLQMSPPGKGSPGLVMELEPVALTRARRRSTTLPIWEPGMKTLVSPRSVLPAL